MNNFYLLRLNSNETGESGEDLGTLYDMSEACKNCGTGALISSALIVNIKSKKELVQTLDGNFLISENLYYHLKASKLKGMEDLRKVVDKKSNELPYYHLTSKYVFPKMLTTSEGIQTENQCSVCKRDGYFDKAIIGNLSLDIKTVVIPPKYKYEIEDKTFLEQSDFYITWECFGNSNIAAHSKYVVRYARPRVIISNKMKTHLELLEIGNADFFQVEIKNKYPL